MRPAVPDLVRAPVRFRCDRARRAAAVCGRQARHVTESRPRGPAGRASDLSVSWLREAITAARRPAPNCATDRPPPPLRQPRSPAPPPARPGRMEATCLLRGTRYGRHGPRVAVAAGPRRGRGRGRGGLRHSASSTERRPQVRVEGRRRAAGVAAQIAPRTARIANWSDKIGQTGTAAS